MGSPCAVSLYCQSEAAFSLMLSLCQKEVERLENRYSRYLPESLLCQINTRAGTNEVTLMDDELGALINYADTAFKVSDGLFDVTSGVLRNVWNFYQSPSANIKLLESEILSLVGWNKVVLKNDSIYLPLAGMELDFGGIVKEFAADKCVNLCRANGVFHGLIDMGGDIAAVGPHLDGSPWKISISNPAIPSHAMAEILINNGAVASSGDYHRFIDIDGKKYSHILNPKTGWPVRGIKAVSVQADNCTLAGTLASTAMLMGDKGISWLDSLGVTYVCVDKDDLISTNFNN